MKMFPCEKCGCCCRQVGKTFLGKSMALPDDSCKYLDKEKNLCTIYAERPIICRVDEWYETHLYKEMSREKYYRLNKEICSQLQAKNLL